MMRALLVGLIAGTLTYFGGMATASGQGGLVARSPDLIPIPSRIEHGVVSVRNVGSAASAPSVVTVNCHVPGQRGGCVDIPDRLIAPYEDGAFPNRLVVHVPALQPGQVFNHHLTFWNEVDWPAGAYQFDYVADAGAANAESNEGNNTGSHVWNVP
jgi:hypothetical protein